MFNIALALILAGYDNGQAMFLTQAVAGAADIMVTPFIGVVLPIVHKADRIKNDVVMDMAFVYVGGEDKF